MTILYFSRGFLDFPSLTSVHLTLLWSTHTCTNHGLAKLLFWLLSSLIACFPCLTWMEIQLNIIRKYSIISFKKPNKSGLHPFPILGSTREEQIAFLPGLLRVLKKSFSVSPLPSGLLEDGPWVLFAWISNSICWKNQFSRAIGTCGSWSSASNFIPSSFQGTQGHVDDSISISQLQISGKYCPPNSCQCCLLLFLPPFCPHLSAPPPSWSLSSRPIWSMVCGHWDGRLPKRCHRALVMGNSAYLESPSLRSHSVLSLWRITLLLRTLHACLAQSFPAVTPAHWCVSMGYSCALLTSQGS